MGKIFLTSKASKVFDKIAPILKKERSHNVLFITTASNLHKNKDFIEEDASKLEEYGFKVNRFDIAGKNNEELKFAINKSDVLFIAGGNTFLLMQEIRKSGFDKLIIDVLNSKKTYIGSSAGSVILGPTIEYIKYFDDLSKAQLNNFNGLNIFNFLLIPHFNQKEFIKKYAALKKEYAHYKFKTITDNQFIYNKGNSALMQII
jgi:dipeptidase E